MLQKKVKASGITNLTDARYFAAWEVEWLSFNFDEQAAAYIEPATMKAIREWVDGVEVVGEFTKQRPAEVKEWAKLLELNWLQVDSTMSRTDLEQLQDYHLIQELYVHSDTTINTLKKVMDLHKDVIRYFQLNLDAQGITWQMLGKTTSLSRENLQELCRDYNLIISIAFQPEELPVLSDYLPYKALNLQGGEEEKIGFKSFDDMDAILEQLEVEE